LTSTCKRTAELALGSASGAVVAMDPRNGEILAMVSHPSYDPNAFAVRINRTDWNQLITNPNHPLMNKAIQDQLAPGSTFKIIMSAAGLQEGVAQDMHVNCVGGGTFYGRFFHCDRHHGVLNISQAIPLSCDTFFLHAGSKNWASTPSPSMPPPSAWGRRPASTCPTRWPASCPLLNGR